MNYPIAHNEYELIQYIKSNTECRMGNDFDGSIDLSEQNLTELPEWFSNIINIGDGSQYDINELNLTNNQLMILPDSIGNFQDLNELYVGRNHLFALPDTIGRLANLRKLLIFKNRLLYLPTSMSLLQNLEKIDVSENYIEAENLEIIRRMDIGEKKISPQKDFIWPQNIETLEYYDALWTFMDRNIELEIQPQTKRNIHTWLKEFNPKGKKNVLAVLK